MCEQYSRASEVPVLEAVWRLILFEQLARLSGELARTSLPGSHEPCRCGLRRVLNVI
jgi:hypothetical protein